MPVRNPSDVMAAWRPANELGAAGEPKQSQKQPQTVWTQHDAPEAGNRKSSGEMLKWDHQKHCIKLEQGTCASPGWRFHRNGMMAHHPIPFKFSRNPPVLVCGNSSAATILASTHQIIWWVNAKMAAALELPHTSTGRLRLHLKCGKEAGTF